ncbi:MAG: SUMF1/EgtB/PvdO family nonheme iron enzyme [bacterium]
MKNKKTLIGLSVVLCVLTLVASQCANKTSAPTAATSTSTPTFTSTATPISDSSELVLVPGGTFTQTEETGTNSFSHTVSAFKLGKYEVTYDLWYIVYQWAIVHSYTFENAGVEGNDGVAGDVTTTAKLEPVTMINWRDVIVWCNAYSEKSGLTSIYYSDAGYTTPLRDSTSGAYGSTTCTATGCFDNPYVNWTANGYRLPTEGEWQYAASYINGTSWTAYNYASGATTDYSSSDTTNVGWYDDNSSLLTHPVANKRKNGLELYDMSGNVWERCWDWAGTYPVGSATDYRGMATGSLRVIRGGGFDNPNSSMQVGKRQSEGPFSFPLTSIGFRVAKKN